MATFEALATLRVLLDTLWPQLCPICERTLVPSADVAFNGTRSLLHRSCLRALPREAAKRCSARRVDQGVPVCAWLRDDRRFFAVLHAAKYGGRPSLLRYLGEGLARHAHAAGWVETTAIVTPVPDDARRRRERGFSPAEILAIAVARRCGATFRNDLIRRRRRAAPVATLKAAAQRRDHHVALWGSGRIAEIARDRPIVLVDDQVTTGSTVSAIVSLLGARGNPLLVLSLAASTAAPGEV